MMFGGREDFYLVARGVINLFFGEEEIKWLQDELDAELASVICDLDRKEAECVVLKRSRNTQSDDAVGF